jgi:hypothetical protein
VSPAAELAGLEAAAIDAGVVRRAHFLSCHTCGDTDTPCAEGWRLIADSRAALAALGRARGALASGKPTA